jgi:PEP-CTERM motif
MAPAHASLLLNGSFEAPNRGSNTYCYMGAFCTTSGWAGSAVIIASNSGAWGNPSGLGSYAFGSQLVGLQNGLYTEQLLNLAAGTYSLTWNDAGRAGYNNTAYDILFDDVQINAASYTTAPGQAWSQHSLTFTASGEGALRFQGRAVSRDGTAFIDNLSLEVQSLNVPEPQSLALVMVALLGAGVASRRKTAR